MKESYVEGIATHGGPESCAVARKSGGEALTGVRAGRVSSRERQLLWGADAVGGCGRPHVGRRYREASRDPARSQTPSTYREIAASPVADGAAGRVGNTFSEETGRSQLRLWRMSSRRRPCREVQGRTPTMNGAGKSDRPEPLVVPEKPANKDGSCLRRRGYGEPHTGTQAETPDTAKVQNLRSRRPAATGPRNGWRKGDWPKGIRASKTRPGHCAGRARQVRWSGYVDLFAKQRDRIGRCGSPRSCTTSAALMAKAWCVWLGERSGLTGRLVFDGAGRSRTEQDGAANGLRWAVSSIFILGLSDSRSDHYTTCPATVKHAERRSAILGDQVVT